MHIRASCITTLPLRPQRKLALNPEEGKNPDNCQADSRRHVPAVKCLIVKVTDEGWRACQVTVIFSNEPNDMMYRTTSVHYYNKLIKPLHAARANNSTWMDATTSALDHMT